MKEIYKEYPSDKRYRVSNKGNVIGVKGYVLKPFVDKKNYSTLEIAGTTRKVHHLVAETFLSHTVNGHKSIVDHIDNNPQNNNLENLQITTHRHNLSKDRKGKTSKYTGVSIKPNGTWVAQVCLGGKVYYLGTYKTQEEAEVQYVDALCEYNQYKQTKEA